jgi:hypothetical protein
MRALAAALCAISLVGGQSCRCGREPPTPTPAPRAEAADAGAAEAALLLSSKGKVELQRRDGAWGPAALGDRVGVSDGLRTPGDGEAELSVDGVRVKLHDRTELRLTAVSSGTLRARVRGRVESDVEQGRGRVSLQVQGGDAVADSSGGHFFLTAEGKSVVVAATRGTVALAAAGKTVELHKDEMVHVQAGSLGQPASALKKVLLSVRWPGDKTNRSSVPIGGRVAAGSRVYVQGEPVEVGPTGEFHVDVRLDEGRQRIAVVTIDPFGREKAERSEVTRDQSPPRVQVDTPWRR